MEQHLKVSKLSFSRDPTLKQLMGKELTVIWFWAYQDGIFYSLSLYNDSKFLLPIRGQIDKSTKLFCYTVVRNRMKLTTNFLWDATVWQVLVSQKEVSFSTFVLNN